MRKKLLIVSSVLMLCSMLLLLNLGTTKAHVPGYDYVEYDAIVRPTIDGAWTTSEEWTDAQEIQITSNAVWRTKTYRSGGEVWQCILVEIFTDTTNDPADYWIICVDSEHNGGTTPQTDDILMRVVNHDRLEVYVGTGTGWQRDMGANNGVEYAEGLVATPLNGTAHWVLEIMWDMTGWLIFNQPPYGMFVGENDAGVTFVSWPPGPTSAENDPTQWGTMTAYTGTTIPEGSSILAIVLLSSVAVIVGFRYLRKHPKTKTLTAIKP